jgi:hypothetical protein
MVQAATLTLARPQVEPLEVAVVVHEESTTMTSLEMVDFINASRGGDAATLRHDHFMDKVPKVLGSMSPKFLVRMDTPMPNGGFRVGYQYVFPKREACLMALSYSYELQAKVFDRMTALEARPAPAPTQETPELFMARALLMASEKMKAQEVRLRGLKIDALSFEQVYSERRYPYCHARISSKHDPTRVKTRPPRDPWTVHRLLTFAATQRRKWCYENTSVISIFGGAFLNQPTIGRTHHQQAHTMR